VVPLDTDTSGERGFVSGSGGRKSPAGYRVDPRYGVWGTKSPESEAFPLNYRLILDICDVSEQ